MTDKVEKLLEEMSMPELWSEAKRLGVSKDGKKEELIARIKQAQEDSNDNTEQPKAAKSEVLKEAIYISRYYELRLVMTPSYLKEVGGKVLIIRGTYIQFHDGAYKTSNPEEIAFLDNHPNLGSVFRKIERSDLSGGKSVEQIYHDKFKTLEEREKELVAREELLRKKEIELKGSEEGASQQETVTGIRSTTDQPKF